MTVTPIRPDVIADPTDLDEAGRTILLDLLAAHLRVGGEVNVAVWNEEHAFALSRSASSRTVRRPLNLLDALMAVDDHTLPADSPTAGDDRPVPA